MIAGRLLWKGLGIVTVSAGFSMSFLAWLFSLGILLPANLAGAAEAPAQITLEQALFEALDRNPTLSVERREIDIAKGTRRQAGIYPFNPEIEAGGGGRPGSRPRRGGRAPGNQHPERRNFPDDLAERTARPSCQGSGGRGAPGSEPR